ncbi:MAG TPA: MFS transporter, partial [Hyphomicrobiaceae bacterium]|nr:MFS transporter [Hyphomicrobiaceae bacterium]
AAISPAVGQLAQSWGRRPMLLIGFATLPLRGGLLALTNDPYMVVAVQTLDGISGAVMGVLVPLALADIARGTGRFNLAQGIVGSATGIGATLSTFGAGYLADRFGITSAFWGLAGMGVLALVLVIAMMPETRPSNGD